MTSTEEVKKAPGFVAGTVAVVVVVVDACPLTGDVGDRKGLMKKSDSGS